MRPSVPLAAVLFLVGAAAPSIHGFPINIENSGSALSAASQNELQSILNNLYTGAPSVPNAITGQLHSGAIFLGGASAIRLTIQYQDSYLINDAFGIFSAALATDSMGHPLFTSTGAPMLDSDTLQTLEVFKGKGASTSPNAKLIDPAVANLSVNPGGSVTMAGSPADCATLVHCGTSMPPQPITLSMFGFYINRPTDRPPAGTGIDFGTDGYQGNFWTINQLDSASGKTKGFPEALLYHAPLSATVDRWTIAFNDIHQSNPDFNDFVVTMDVFSQISSVPEPGAIFLFGTALLGSVTMLRRAGRRNSR